MRNRTKLTTAAILVAAVVVVWVGSTPSAPTGPWVAGGITATNGGAVIVISNRTGKHLYVACFTSSNDPSTPDVQAQIKGHSATNFYFAHLPSKITGACVLIPGRFALRLNKFAYWLNDHGMSMPAKWLAQPFDERDFEMEAGRPLRMIPPK